MQFWTPEPSIDDPNRYFYRPPPTAFVGTPARTFLMGGVGFATMLEALETTADRPLLWATTQFVSSAVPGAELEIDIEPAMVGRSVIQARATLREGTRIIQQALAALGGYSDAVGHVFGTMPAVPRPEDCPLAEDRGAMPDSLVAQFEQRIAAQDEDAGAAHIWYREVDGAPMSVGLIAIIADFMGGAHPATMGCTSLDNTLRIFTVKPADWVLGATEFSGFANGVFHGTMHLYSEDGTLLAKASQTALIGRGS